MTVVIPTRGDVPLGQILESLASFGQVIVWENGKGAREVVDGRLMPTHENETDLAVYARYAALDYAAHEIVMTQDDDCLVDAEKLLRIASQYDLTQTIVANMPESRWADYPDSALIGWGGVFHRDLPARAFAEIGFDGRTAPFIEDDDWSDYCVLRSDGGRRFPIVFEDAGFIRRRADNVFTVLTPVVKVDIGFQHLPWAEGPGRMFTTPGHGEERDRMIELARKVRDARC